MIKKIMPTAERKEFLINSFLNNEESCLSEYELAELLLLINSANGCSDESIKKIFAKYDNLNKLLNAPFDELCSINEIGKANATALKVVLACAKRIAQETLIMSKNSVLENWDMFLDFCRQDLAYCEVEEFKIFLLDENMRCILHKTMSKGTINKTVAHPREIIKIALKNKAKYIILTHNHPSGDCKPSEEDVLLTSDICSAAHNVGIEVFDHLIVTSGQIFSFRNEGYLNKFLY